MKNFSIEVGSTQPNLSALTEEQQARLHAQKAIMGQNLNLLAADVREIMDTMDEVRMEKDIAALLEAAQQVAAAAREYARIVKFSRTPGESSGQQWGIGNS